VGSSLDSHGDRNLNASVASRCINRVPGLIRNCGGDEGDTPWRPCADRRPRHRLDLLTVGFGHLRGGGHLYRSTAGEKASQAALPSADGTIGLAQLQFDKSQALLPAGS
jgi:hypothetical protein